MWPCASLFRNSTAARVVLSNTTVEKDVFNAPAYAQYVIDNNGNAYKDTGAGDVAITGQWVTNGTPADYDVRVTLVSGVTPSGSAIATWLNCATDREWHLSQGFPGGKSSELLVEIRRTADSAVLASATIKLNVNYETFV